MNANTGPASYVSGIASRICRADPCWWVGCSDPWWVLSSHPRGHQGHSGIQQDLLPLLLLLDLLHHRLRCQAKSWFENECQRNMKWWGGVTPREWHSQEGQEPDLDQLTAGRQQEDASLMMRVMMMMILMMPLMESDKRLEWLLVFMSEGNLN